MSVQGRAYMQTNYGSRDLRTGPSKIPTSSQLSRPTAGNCRCGTTATSTNVDDLRQDIDHGNCRCTQRACNDRSRVHQASTVGARLSPPQQNPQKMLDLHNRHQSPCQCTATGESRWKLNRTMGICLCAMTRMSTTNDGLQLQRLHSLQSEGQGSTKGSESPPFT